MAPLTLDAILALSNEPDPGVRHASLVQAIGRLELEARMLAARRGGAKEAARSADRSRDSARRSRRRRRSPCAGC